MRTGALWQSDGYIDSRTIIGRWWSNTSFPGMGGYYLGTNTTGVYPHDFYSRGFGFAIRCTIRVE